DRPEDAVTVREALRPFAVGTATLPGWEDFDPVRGLAAATPAAPSEPTVRPALSGMDVFQVHQQLIKDYRAFTESGTIIRDERIAAFIEEDLDAKSQWPDPWLSLNPFFKSGGTVLEAYQNGILHQECTRIFQTGKTKDGTVCDGRPIALYQHQLEAIKTAQSGASYVLTTGTGSGKSLSYIVPI